MGVTGSGVTGRHTPTATGSQANPTIGAMKKTVHTCREEAPVPLVFVLVLTSASLFPDTHRRALSWCCDAVVPLSMERLQLCAHDELCVLE